MNDPPLTVAVLGARTLAQPLRQQSLDLLLSERRVTASQGLAHHVDTGRM